ncbi:MAG: hypothetical protein ACI9OJ_003709 [Myxococcota bacterium]|jgi:hypothetical protein
MIGMELTCVVIVALYVAVRVRFDQDPKAFLRRLGLLMVASWLGENSVIHAYHFYAYSSEWSLFIDQVPLMIVTIWPVVIHSAWDLSGYLLAGRSSSIARRACIGGILVIADASLIEPISVTSGLWWWFQPGLFEVPVVGILGWSYFAALCMVVFESNRRKQRGPLADLAVLIVPAIGTHVLLLASWWGLFRWVNVPINPWPVVAIAWGLSLLLTARGLKVRVQTLIPLREMLVRVPAASFFFVLLAIYGRDNLALVAYALSFAPPYLAATIPRKTM